MKALKYSTADDGSLVVEGVGIPFGGPVNGKDLHGQFFSMKTDFAWDLVPDGHRPLLYQHGLDDTLSTNVIGRWSVKKVDDKGVWVRAQLAARAEYMNEIKDLLDQDALGFSSASMGHLVKVSSKSGEILRWPVVEMSLTPNPANPSAYVVKTAKQTHVPSYVSGKLAILSAKGFALKAEGEVAPEAAVEAPAEEGTEEQAAAAEYTDLASGLSALLGSVVDFYFRAHGYHWNVVGEDFSEYHELFGEIYDDVYSSVDPLAENVRKLGAVAPFMVGDLASMSSLPAGLSSGSAYELAMSLHEANEALLAEISKCFAMATSEDQQGIANFLADRQDMHQKWNWQLSSSLAPEGVEAEGEAQDATDTEEQTAPPMASLAIFAGTDVESVKADLSAFREQLRAFARDEALKRTGRK